MKLKPGSLMLYALAALLLALAACFWEAVHAGTLSIGIFKGDEPWP